MCRLRRLSDRARRADAHRPRRQEGQRLGVQGSNKISDRLCGAAGRLTGRRAKPIAPGTDPRDARRLVRPDERARSLVRDQRQATDRRDRCCCSQSDDEASDRAGDGAPATRRAHPSGQLRPCQPAASADPLSAYGERRRSTSSSAAASPTAPATASRSTARLRSMQRAKSRICPTMRRSRPIPTASRTCSGCAPSGPIPTASLLGPLKATHFGVGDVEGFDSQPDRLGRRRPRRRGHQPAADRAHGIRPHPGRRRSSDRMGGRALSQRRAARLCQVRLVAALCVRRCAASLWRKPGPRGPLWAAGPGPRARRADQRRPGQRAQGQDLVLGRRQPARPRPHHAGKAPRRPDLRKAQAALSIEHGLDDRTSRRLAGAGDARSTTSA